MKVIIKRLSHGNDLPLPAYGTEGSAGFDVYAAIDSDIVLAPGGRKLIPTGFCIELPNGYEAQVRSRSGLAFKNGVAVLNSPGTIDSDYRGEVGVVLINLGQEPFIIQRGMRIAQIVIAAYTKAEFEENSELQSSVRGEGGFGSTGL